MTDIPPGIDERPDTSPSALQALRGDSLYFNVAGSGPTFPVAPVTRILFPESSEESLICGRPIPRLSYDEPCANNPCSANRRAAFRISGNSNPDRSEMSSNEWLPSEKLSTHSIASSFRVRSA